MTPTGSETSRRADVAASRTDAAAGYPGGWRAVGATLSRPQVAVARPAPRSARRRGGAFTLTEVLIVIGLIVLIIALAVPAFNAMTGGRSVDAATNQLSAMLGRARMEAIGLQEPRGLLFYRDPATQRIGCRLVRASGIAPAGSGATGFEFVEDRDPMLLPVGVGLQMVDDALMNGAGPNATASDDRYIGFNTRIGTTDLKVPVGGILLFDQGGRLVSRKYGFHVSRAKATGTKAGGGRELTELGRFLFGETGSVPGTDVLINTRGTGGVDSMRTQFGFVLFEDESFRNQFGTPTDPYGDRDPQFTGGGSVTTGSPEGKEEKWLDDNALPVLINRYNGTLIRGQ